MRLPPGISAPALRGIQVSVTLLLLWALASAVSRHVGDAAESRVRRIDQRTVRIDGPRGTIYDRHETPLARSVLAFDVRVSCWADRGFPGALADRCIAALAQDRPLDGAARARIRGLFALPAPSHRRELEVRRSQPWRYHWQRWLAKGVQSSVALRELRELGRARWRGYRFRFDFVESWQRVYPLGRSACHVVGMIAEDAGGRPVRTGLEAMPVLAPQQLQVATRRDARGRAFSAGNGPLPLTGEIGLARVVTTLDGRVQERAYEAITSAVALAEAQWGLLLVIDLRSGDILALTGTPSFEPEYRGGAANYWPMTHQALFEPGSVIKPLVIALALERALVRPGEVIRCCGADGSRIWTMRSKHSRGQRRIIDDHEVGVVPLEQLVIQSSNIGAVRVGRRGGPPFHRELLHLFRLADPPLLGLPLPRRRDGTLVTGLVPPEARLRKLRSYDLYSGPSLSFGYELNVYPLTFAAAFATTVTGRQFRLRLVRELRDASGRAVPLPAAGPGRRVLSASTVAWMRDTLARVVTDPHGTAHLHIAGPGVDGVIAGKTGTSVRESRSGDRTCTASFAGFTPVREPRYLAMAILQKKKVRRFYGGRVAAPAVRDVLSYVAARERRLRQLQEDAAALAEPARTPGGVRARN